MSSFCPFFTMTSRLIGFREFWIDDFTTWSFWGLPALLSSGQYWKMFWFWKIEFVLTCVVLNMFLILTIRWLWCIWHGLNYSGKLIQRVVENIGLVCAISYLSLELSWFIVWICFWSVVFWKVFAALDIFLLIGKCFWRILGKGFFLDNCIFLLLFIFWVVFLWSWLHKGVIE